MSRTAVCAWETEASEHQVELDGQEHCQRLAPVHLSGSMLTGKPFQVFFVGWRSTCFLQWVLWIFAARGEQGMFVQSSTIWLLLLNFFQSSSLRRYFEEISYLDVCPLFLRTSGSLAQASGRAEGAQLSLVRAFCSYSGSCEGKSGFWALLQAEKEAGEKRLRHRYGALTEMHL